MIVIIDYRMGNSGSIHNMFRRLGITAIISSDCAEIEAAEKLILPGVGAFDSGMRNLREGGLADMLTRRIFEDQVPTLGICLGMQLMTEASEEGREPGLGWVAGRTVHLRCAAEQAARGLRFPHIGWNFIELRKAHPVFADLPDEPRFYFVHTYKVLCADHQDVLAHTSYGQIGFTSAFARDNIVGVQFHPEKSHRFGMALLRNFASWNGVAASAQVEATHG
jgi:glutamine amidotransferase